MKAPAYVKAPRVKLTNEIGSSLLAVLVVMAICLVITAGMLQSASSTSNTRYVAEANTKHFYDVERTINEVTAWLQNNSKNLVTAFNSTNFSNNFDLGNPAVGGNEGSSFAVPTLIKMKGTDNAVQLTNDSYFGTSAFPSTTNVDSGTAFDAISSFQSTSWGTNVKVRLLAVWALQTDGHYQPIFRVDAITGGSGPEHGVHGLNFIKSALVTGSSGIGYYGGSGGFDTGTPNNQCWSYRYSWDAGSSTWSRGAARSNCLILSSNPISLKSAIHGNVMTNVPDGITLGSGGSVSGTKCQAAGCVTYTLPVNPDWNTRCGSETAVDFSAGSSVPSKGIVSGSPQNVPSGSTLAMQCYRDITVGSNKTIVFNTPDQPYYIRNLDLQNNSNSVLKFATVGPGHKYTLYVDNFVGGSLNGNQFVGTNLAPNQLEVYLTQDTTFTLNGDATMNGVFVGTAGTTIKHNGNFPFYGAYRAGTVNVIGNAVLGYDEALASNPALTDINFTLYKASQRYR